jgi:glycopeptide antibiotics resistance protein
MPAVLAVAGGCLLATLLVLPFVVISYRRRGELGFGHTVAAFGFLVYSLAIATYTMLPLPQLDTAWCTAHPGFTHAQFNPLRFIDDIRHNQRGSGLTAYLYNPAFQQIAFNIALFVPLGAYLRQFFRRSVPTTIAIGFLVSLAIECTQRTGNWFLFPCPYRLFDVDDLIANTLGAAVGVLFAPLLRPLTRDPSAPPTAPRPVTTFRRLMGMVLDVVAVYTLGGFLAIGANAVAVYVFGVDMDKQTWATAADQILGIWIPVLVLLVLPSLTPTCATAGQRAVRLRRVRADGQPVGRRVVPALLFGSTGYFVVFSLNGHVTGPGLLMFVLIAGNVVLAFPKAHRGLSGVLAGLYIADSRAAGTTVPAALADSGPTASQARHRS